MTRRLIAILTLLLLAVETKAEPPQLRTWTDTSGKFQIEATFVGFEKGVVQLRKEDGQVVRVELGRLSQADHEYVHRIAGRRKDLAAKTRPSQSDARRSNVIEFDLPNGLQRPAGGGGTSDGDGTRARAGASGGDGASTAVRELVVTGLGLDADKALQNAFSHAIEHAVGVLVDAETVVENDQIIRDKVLTHSRGFVEKYDVLKRWEADGLHHAQIRAAVAAEKLVKSLRSHNIAIREVEGRRMSLQLKHEVASEEDAAEMFARIMEDYTIDKLFRVEILGKPEVVEKDQVAAKLVVPLRLRPDWGNWKRLHDKLEALLRRVAAKRSAFTTLPRQAEMNEERWIALETEVAKDMARRLAVTGASPFGRRRAGDPPVIALLKSHNRTGGVTSWDVFQVPDASGGIADILNRLKARRHRVRLVLLDANEQPVLEERMKLEVKYYYNNASIVGYHNTCDGLCHFGVKAYWLAPLFWQENGIRYRFVYEPCKVTIRVELDRLGKVATCAAFAEIDEDEGGRRHRGPFR